MKEEKEPLMALRPRFNGIRFFLNKYALTFAAVVFLMIFTLQMNLVDIPNLPVYYIIMIIAYIIFIVVNAISTKREFGRIRYLFYDDKLIIINRTKKGQDMVIHYEDIVDILMLQNYVQKFFNDGELIIKLEQGRILSKTVTLIGIGNFKETVQDISSIVYGN